MYHTPSVPVTELQTHVTNHDVPCTSVRKISKQYTFINYKQKISSNP